VLINRLGGLLERKFHFNLLAARILEWNSELLLSFYVLDSQRDHLLILQFGLYTLKLHAFLADQIWNFDPAGQQNLDALRHRYFFSILQEVLHAAPEFGL
jgi:hypothetical protein